LGIQPAIYDLAFALITFCGRREKPVDGSDIWSLTASFEFDENKARKFLKAYMRAAGGLDRIMRSALMEQIRLVWAHARIDGALKVPPSDRPRFFARNLQGPFVWIENHHEGDWF